MSGGQGLWEGGTDGWGLGRFWGGERTPHDTGPVGAGLYTFDKPHRTVGHWEGPSVNGGLQSVTICQRWLRL